MKESILIDVDGKYSYISYEDDWRIHVLRYGNPWLVIEKGHKAILSLMYKLKELNTLNESLKTVIDKEKLSEKVVEKYSKENWFASCGIHVDGYILLFYKKGLNSPKIEENFNGFEIKLEELPDVYAL